MQLLNKLTISSLNLNKRRTLVTIIGITLAVALLVAVATMFFCAGTSLVNFEKLTDGDYHVRFSDVPVSDVARIRNHTGVESVSAVSEVGYAKLAGSRNEDKPYAYIAAYDDAALKHLSIRLLSGRLPENDSELVIPQHLITNGRVKDIEVGDTITLSVGTRVFADDPATPLGQGTPFSAELGDTIIDTTKRTYTVVGLAMRPAYGVEYYWAPGYTFITYSSDIISETPDLYVRYDPSMLNQEPQLTADILGIDAELYRHFKEGNAGGNVNSDIETWKEAAAEMERAKYEFSYNQYVIDLEGNILNSRTFQGLAAMAVVVVLIILLTSVYCIKNSFDISITEKIRQYGMLSSIGATRRQIRRNVFYEAYILAAIAIPAGIFLGIFAAYILIHVSNFFLRDSLAEGLSLSFSLSYDGILLAIFFSLIMVFLSALGSALRASRISPIQAIRSTSEILVKGKRLRAPAYLRRWFGIGGEISYKNLKRSRRKYRTTVVSIIVSVSVFIAMSAFVKIAFHAVSESLGNYDSNLIAGFKPDGEKGSSELRADISELSSIERITIYRAVTMEAPQLHYSEEYKKAIYPSASEEAIAEWKPMVEVAALGEKEYALFAKEVGISSAQQSREAIFINETYNETIDENGFTGQLWTTRQADWTAGEDLTLLLDNGEDTPLTYTIPVAAVTSKHPFGLSYYGAMVLVVKDTYWDSLFGETAAQYQHFECYIKASDAAAAQDSIESIMDSDDGYANYVYSINNIEQSTQQMRQLFTLVAIFMYGFILVIALIGVTNIFNTITTNMELRRREFAMLRSIGMTDREFSRMVRLEALFFGVKSLLIGVPLGLVFSYAVHYASYSSANYIPHFAPPFLGIGIAIAAVFVLLFCIMHYTMARIKKQNVIETIRNENI